MSKNLYIVPHDFTNVGDAALKYALFLSKPRLTDIMLLHVVKSESKIPHATEQLEKIIHNLDLSVGSSKVYPKVVVGTIFDDIPEVAKESDARLIIMGTHGAVGMQKLFGSYAMKVITNSYIPFLVVQEELVKDQLNHILVPITTEKESLQSIHIAGEIARTFDSKLTVMAEHQTDSKFATQLKVRLSVIQQEMEEKGVEVAFEITKSKQSFQKDILSFSKKNTVDLIATAYDSSTIFPQFERYTQGLITNEHHIPCVVVNAKLQSNYYF